MFDHEYYRHCKKNPDVVEDYYGREKIMKSCQLKNCNNDCSDYEPSIFTKIKNLLKRR